MPQLNADGCWGAGFLAMVESSTACRKLVLVVFRPR